MNRYRLAVYCGTRPLYFAVDENGPAASFTDRLSALAWIAKRSGGACIVPEVPLESLYHSTPQHAVTLSERVASTLRYLLASSPVPLKER